MSDSIFSRNWTVKADFGALESEIPGRNSIATASRSIRKARLGTPRTPERSCTARTSRQKRKGAIRFRTHQERQEKSFTVQSFPPNLKR